MTLDGYYGTAPSRRIEVISFDPLPISKAIRLATDDYWSSIDDAASLP